MAGPEDFQFAIVAADYTAETFAKVDKRAKRTADSAEKAAKGLGKYADKAKSGFDRIMGPARALYPQIDSLAKPFSRLAQAGSAVGAAFRPEKAKEAGAALTGAAKAAASLNTASQAAAAGGLAKTAAGLASVEAEGAAAGTAMAGAGEVAGAATVGMVGLGGAAMVAATGVGALGVAFVAAEVAASKFISPFARQGQQIGITAESIGIAAGKLQEFRGASELAGVSADATTGAIASLAKKAHDAQYGMGSATDYAAFRMAGIKLPNKGEALDVNKIALQAADAIKAQRDPNAQANLAGALGVGGALPFFRQGSGAIQKDQAQYRGSGDVYSAADLAKSKSESRSLTAFNQAAHGAAKGAAMAGIDANQPAVDMATAALTGMSGQTDKTSTALARLGNVANELVGATPASAATPATQRAGSGAKPYAPGASAAPTATVPIRSMRAGNTSAPLVPGAPPQPSTPAQPVPPVRSLRAGIGATVQGPAMKAVPKGAATQGKPADPAQEAIAFFEGKGLSRSAAIGLAAAFLGESGLNPDMHQRGGGPGYAIGQWEKPRQSDFKTWSGHDIHGTSRQEQLEFSWDELHTKQFSGALSDLQRPGITPAEAAVVASKEYEKPGAQGAAEDRARRAAALDRATPSSEVTGTIILKVDAPPSTKVIAKSGSGVQLKVERTGGFLR